MLLYDASYEGNSSQNSVLLIICLLGFFLTSFVCVHSNSDLLHFVLMKLTCLFAAQVEPKIFLQVSYLAPISCSFF
jgi:hypothetical protein